MFWCTRAISPTTMSRIPTKGRRGMLSEQQSATQETMKAAMRTRRAMIISAATALAQAAEESRGLERREERRGNHPFQREKKQQHSNVSTRAGLNQSKTFHRFT